MIKSSVCFVFFPCRPQEGETPCPHRAQTSKLSLTDQLSWEGCSSLFFYMCCVCVCECAMCFCFIVSFPSSTPHSFPRSCPFQVPLAGTVNWYWCVLSPWLQLEEGIKHIRTKSQASTWYLYILSLSSPSFPYFWLPLHCSPLFPTHSALQALSSVPRWLGRILFMGRAIWGACHMAEVIRWSTGEEVMMTKLERYTQASLCICFVCFLCTHVVALERTGPEWDSTTGDILKQ